MGQRSIRTGVLFLALVAIVLSGNCGKKDVFSSKEGGFEIETSSIPTQKKQVVMTPEGPIDIHTLTFEIKNPAAEYWVIYIDYPERTVRQKGVNQILNEARDGSVDNVRGRLLNERDILLEGYSGKEIEYEGEAADENIYKSRMYLVKRRLYVILTTAPRGKGPSEEAEKFLSSFKLL